jgi:hypothetical protein
VLVSGMIAADPHQGGATWAVLQYLTGLRQLGHDVYFVEPIAEHKQRPAGASLSRSANAAYLQAVMAQFGFDGRWALLRPGTRNTCGVAYEQLRRIATRADVLINISGMLAEPALTEQVPVRAYLDLDPAFNQLWHAAEGIDMRFDGHTHFVTVGQAIGTPGCAIPTCGRTWIPTLQPVVLSEWPSTPGPSRSAWTTIGHWRGYGSIRYRGVFYGQKAHSVRRLIALPRTIDEPLRPALSIDPGDARDLEALATNGWHLLDPARVAATPNRYRRFIQASKGEIGIAKSGYVESRCGWFSDRSACYLASGRPVIAQDTAFSRFLPTGRGLFAFSTVDDVRDAVGTIGGAYARHCRHARDIAEEYFEAGTVLGRLLDRIGASHDARTSHRSPADRRLGVPVAPRRSTG